MEFGLYAMVYSVDRGGPSLMRDQNRMSSSGKTPQHGKAPITRNHCG